jgi:hypothetical protein
VKALAANTKPALSTICPIFILKKAKRSLAPMAEIFFSFLSGFWIKSAYEISSANRIHKVWFIKLLLNDGAFGGINT